ncbi:hypothetical protein Pint_10124 [Pistacia integerrima]|uniref:Uncharacterized protein n=1 Tax=Pistacia integerrima TaxID=434235 RepID=A0ACC0XIE5_9ROSI|nr:hypothetical protein Pint_10124 [Pistacia integerrima]
MAVTLPKLGSSLAVPCVQEIAKKPLTRVPQRYVRPDQENPFFSNNNSVLQVPVVDMQRLLSADFMDSEIDKLHQACKEWGFFQLINHTVDISLVEKVKSEIEKFFTLPIEEEEIVTNGIYRSIEHRATVNSTKERLSIATFYCPKLDGEMGPAPSLITPETPALFRRIGVEDYFKGLFTRKLDGKAYIDVMRIDNQEE